MKKEKYVWLLVTADEYELPLYVAETVSELADFVGLAPSTIRSAISHAKKKGFNCKYKKVLI